jgi:ATP-dependent Clp protease protease subunit
MQTADVMIAQLLSLESKNKKQEITMYINSPGGDVVAGLAIVDTMEHIACPVSTLAVGLAASMGAFILAHGDHQRRFALPHATIMIHQPSGGVHGQATDIEIQAEHMLLVRDRLNVMLAERTGHSVEKIKRDTERDKFMSAIQALEYGLIDEIMQPKKEK